MACQLHLEEQIEGLMASAQYVQCVKYTWWFGGRVSFLMSLSARLTSGVESGGWVPRCALMRSMMGLVEFPVGLGGFPDGGWVSSRVELGKLPGGISWVPRWGLVNSLVGLVTFPNQVWWVPYLGWVPWQILVEVLCDIGCVPWLGWMSSLRFKKRPMMMLDCRVLWWDQSY